VGDVEIEQAIVVKVAERDSHTIAGVEDAPLRGFILEVIAFVDEKTLLAKIVHYVEIQLAITVDIQKFCGITPTPIIRGPLVRFSLEGAITLIAKQQIRGAAGRVEPRAVNNHAGMA